MNYKVIKADHKYGLKDGKKWDLVSLVLDLPEGGIAQVQLWNIVVDVLPKAGDLVFLKYELKQGEKRCYGKPVGFDIV